MELREEKTLKREKTSLVVCAIIDGNNVTNNAPRCGYLSNTKCVINCRRIAKEEGDNEPLADEHLSYDLTSLW